MAPLPSRSSDLAASAIEARWVWPVTAGAECFGVPRIPVESVFGRRGAMGPWDVSHESEGLWTGVGYLDR